MRILFWVGLGVILASTQIPRELGKHWFYIGVIAGSVLALPSVLHGSQPEKKISVPERPRKRPRVTFRTRY